MTSKAAFRRKANQGDLKHFQQVLLKQEKGAVRKEPGGRLNVALMFPNTYQVGAANLGLAVLYRILNQRPDTLAERFFLPDSIISEKNLNHRAWLPSLESGRLLLEFDLILASLPFENDLPNFSAMLEMGGLPPWAQDRQNHPLVIAGGIVPMLNPEPLADIADGFLLGEAEAVLDDFINFYKQISADSSERLTILKQLALRFASFYAPAFYEPSYDANKNLLGLKAQPGLPQRIKVPKFQGPPTELAQSVFSAPQAQFGDMHLLEIGRGCGHACRFCAAGHIYRPPRLGSASDFEGRMLELADQGQRVGLVSAAVSDLPGLGELALQVCRQGAHISVSSLRADCLDDDLIQALKLCGQQTVALAPEAGSDRLRRIINKNLEQRHLEDAATRLIKAGIPNLRLYFMIGLPGENQEDLQSLCDLVLSIKNIMIAHSRAHARLGKLTVGVSVFVPKPWTPLQWEAMPPLKEIKTRLNFIKKVLGKQPNIKISPEPPSAAYLQAALARGDRRLGQVIVAMGQGLKMAEAFQKANLKIDYFASRPRTFNEYLPWALLDHGLTTDYLQAEALRARQETLSPPCNPAHCRRCGVC